MIENKYIEIEYTILKQEQIFDSKHKNLRLY